MTAANTETPYRSGADDLLRDYHTGAALLAVEVWRQHRLAIGILNSFRTEFPAEHALLLQDPL